MAAGAVLTLNVVVGPSLSRIRLGRWRSMKQAEADWEPRFAEVFTAKEGAPRIVERTIAPCGEIGRASCRERVKMWEGGEAWKKKQRQRHGSKRRETEEE